MGEDHDGAFTARTLDGPAAAAGASARNAVDQVKRFLDGVRKSCGELEAPDFADAELCFFSVSVRSAYEVGPGVRNYDKPLAMRLPAVVGRCDDGSFSCVLPTLDARFQCESRKSVEPTAKDVARHRLEGLEPRELSRFLPAKSYRLDAVFVPRERRRREGRGPGLPILRRTAEPLAGPFMRRTVGGVWRRADEIAAVAERLRQRECTRLLLVGEGGVGKTAVLVAAVRRLELESSSDAADPPGERVAVRDRFWLTSGARIVGGMRYLGQWQERCQAMIGELDGVYGALCIDNLLGLIRAGGSDPSSSVAAFLAPYLERGELRMVAEATPAELDACRRLMPGFAALLQIVRIEPFGLNAARVVLRRRRRRRAGRPAWHAPPACRTPYGISFAASCRTSRFRGAASDSCGRCSATSRGKARRRSPPITWSRRSSGRPGCPSSCCATSGRWTRTTSAAMSRGGFAGSRPPAMRSCAW